MKLLSGECHRTSLMISQLWFMWWLGAVKQRTITWAIVDEYLSSYDVNMPPLVNSLLDGYCSQWNCKHVKDLLHKSHNVPVPCATMHHFATEMCTCVHISVTKWCILGSSTLWELKDGSIEQLPQHPMNHARLSRWKHAIPTMVIWQLHW